MKHLTVYSEIYLKKKNLPARLKIHKFHFYIYTFAILTYFFFLKFQLSVVFLFLFHLVLVTPRNLDSDDVKVLLNRELRSVDSVSLNIDSCFSSACSIG